jgi:hypothetical protein
MFPTGGRVRKAREFRDGMPFTFTCNGKCPKCGAENFTSPYRPADFAPVSCLSCGHLTTVNDALHPFPPDGAEPVTDGDK